MTGSTPIDTGDLWSSVDQLTRPSREKLTRPGAEKGRTVTEQLTIPSLWTQMVELLASDVSGGGHGKASIGSRSPVNLAVLDLLRTIETTVLAALTEFGTPARPLPGPVPAASRPRRTVHLRVARDQDGCVVPDDRAGQLLERSSRRPPAPPVTAYDVPAELRHLAAVVVTSRAPELINHWARVYYGWARQAESVLTLDTESLTARGLRGLPCPACGQQWVYRQEEDETYRDPALVASLRDGEVLHAVCRSCGEDWWKGDGLERLSRSLSTPSPDAERMSE